MGCKKRFVDRLLPITFEDPCWRCDRHVEMEPKGPCAKDRMLAFNEAYDRCREGCELYSYFLKYNFNRALPPELGELDLLLELAGEVLEKRYKGEKLATDDLDRLSAWGERLSSVL